jgi:hypothetical protein
VWSWDPAFYATGAVDLWFRLAHRPSAWFEAMRSVLWVKAPGIAWFGQLFVPLGRWLGTVERGLLASVLLAQLGTLVLLYRVGRRMAPLWPWPAVAGVVFAASSPLFVSLSHHFLTEALQAFAIASVWWVAAESPSTPPHRTLLRLVVAASLGLVAKVSTPAFVVVPASLAAYRAVRGLLRTAPRPVLGAPDAGWAVVAAGTVGLCAAWYARNGRQAYAFAAWASSGDVALEFGHKDTVIRKLAHWLDALQRAFVLEPAGWLLLLAALLAIWIAFRRHWRGEGRQDPPAARALLGASLAQIVLVLAVLSVTINEETRYLLALAPSLAVLVIGLASALRTRVLAAGLVLAFVGQWAIVHGRHLAPPTAGSTFYWGGSPVADAPRMKELALVVDRACTPRWAGRVLMTGVNFDWLNLHTLAFYSTKAQLRTGFRCYFEYLGHAPGTRTRVASAR